MLETLRTRTAASGVLLSAVEASLLAGLLGAESLVGLDDPFYGWLTDEIRDAWDIARDELAQRQVLQVEPVGQIVMDGRIKSLMRVWAFPDVSLCVTTSSEGAINGRTSYLHVAAEMVVEQVEEPAGTIRLAALSALSDVCERAAALGGVGGQPAASAKRISLPARRFNQMQKIGEEQGAEAIEEDLLEAGADADTAATLASALHRPVRQARLVAMAQRGSSWEVASLGFLVGKKGLWQLRTMSKHGQQWIEAAPCSAEDASKHIGELIQRFAPDAGPSDSEG